VGINTLISGTNRGLGFAIPSNIVKNVATQLVEKGRVSRSWLGISIAGIEEVEQFQRVFTGLTQGVVVRGVEPGAPAETAGLQTGDVILKVDGVSVALAADLQKQILGKKIGQQVVLDVWRSGKNLQVGVRTGEQPDPYLRASMRRKSSPAAPSPLPPKAAAPSSPGLKVKDATPETLSQFGIRRKAGGGVIVIEVEPQSAAAVAGLEPGDIITEAGGNPVRSQQDLNRALESTDTARGILLLVERGNRRTFAILKP